MSFIPQPCPPGADDCCSITFTGFCLEDGTPIGIVIQDNEQIGWFDLQTGIFTPGPPPEGTGICPQSSSPLDCATDSVTTCPQAEATAVNLSAVVIPVGVSIATRPGDWAVNDAPLAGVAATASKAAVVGASHVATAVSFSVITTTTAPVTTTLTVTLRDGSSGAGTVLMIWRVRVAAAQTDINVAQVTLGGLNIIGSTNTDMTLEFDAGVINTLEDVSLTGYTVT